ncbi:MAG: hypothetical protein FWG80_03240 [Alphaproteobacteria bacterium]|nr:hypothetical protein [Alphaproteobacteria bacterium]
MRDDEKMFHWGFGLFASAFVLMAVLQVCSRAQERARARTRADIIRAGQEYAEEQARFSALIRPEVLRSTVAEMYPKFEPIGFKKNITANEIPSR